MKILLIISFLVLSVIGSFAQHEGIQRHFSSYTLDIVSVEDYSYFDDTLTDNFFLYTPQQKYCLNPLGLPNPGTAFTPSLFSERQTHSFWFFDNYIPYIQQHDGIVYFDTKKPFTLFTFSGGAGGQELVSFMHTQNIKPEFNFVFKYDIINSDGHYQYSKSKVNALSLATAYTKRKYQNHFNFIFNKVNNLENGGLSDLNYFDSTYFAANLYSVNLENAQNAVSQLGIQYNQEYRFGKYNIDTIIVKNDTAINKNFNSNFSVIHDIKLDRYYRIYQDVPSDFYSQIFRDSLTTFDSTSYKTIDNKILLNFNLAGKGKIETFQVLAGISNYLYNYGLDTLSDTYLSNYITGRVSFATPKTSFNANVNYCFAGTDIFDTDLSANIGFQLSENVSWNSSGGFSVLNPSIYMYYYSSNHYEWEIDAFKSTNIYASTDFNLQKISLSLGANFNFIDNYFIFNEASMPVQIGEANLIGDAWVSKMFNFGKFHWLTKFSYQYIADRSRVPLPEFVGYSSLYFKSPLFHNAMILQVGFDVKYHSAVYGYAYNPALSAFYQQTSAKFGNYPNAAFNLAVKVKRLRGFVRLSNFNSYFMPKTYFLTDKIPDNPFSFNFGISWEFYD